MSENTVNESQKPAFTARDIFTVPNAMSATGAYLTWKGAEQLDTPQGLAKVIVGRSIDAVDGTVARKLGQESNFGATVDAGLDKLVTTKLLWELWKSNAAPKAVLGTIATLSAVNAASTAHVMLTRPGEPIRPTLSGKVAMAGETVALFAHSAAHTAEHTNHPNASKWLKRLGNAAFIASLPAAVHATGSYLKRAKRT